MKSIRRSAAPPDPGLSPDDGKRQITVELPGGLQEVCLGFVRLDPDYGRAGLQEALAHVLHQVHTESPQV